MEFSELIDRIAWRVGPTVFWLEAQEPRWILRRTEQIELLEPTLARRAAVLLFRLPAERHALLELAVRPMDDRDLGAGGETPPAEEAEQTEKVVVVPVGRAPHRPLRRGELEAPGDGFLLPARATRRIVLSGLREWVRIAFGDHGLEGAQGDLASLVYAVGPNERDTALTTLGQRLPPADTGVQARGCWTALQQSAAGFPMLVAASIAPAAPRVITMAYDEPLAKNAIGVRESLGLREVTFRLDLPVAAHRRPALHVELSSAPAGTRATRLEIYGNDGPSGDKTLVAADSVLAATPGSSGTVHVPAGDPARPTEPDRTVAEVELELIPEELPVPVGISSVLTVAVLWVAWATAETLGTGAGSALLGAPALLNSLISGFKGGSIASSTARFLRLAGLVVSLFGIAGAIAIAATDKKAGVVDNLAVRDDWLLWFALAATLSAVVPVWAALRSLRR